MNTALADMLRQEVLRLRERLAQIEGDKGSVLAKSSHGDPVAPSGEDSNKALVRDFIDAINRQDWARFDQLVAPEFIRHSSTFGQSQITNRDQLREYLQGEYKTFPDAFERINFLVAEGDKVVVHSHCYATQHGQMGPYPPSGRTLSADFISIYRIAANRIVEAWAEWDCLNGLIQLGHFEPPAM